MILYCQFDIKGGALRMLQIPRNTLVTTQNRKLTLSNGKTYAVSNYQINSVALSNGGGADKVMTAITSKSADIGLMGPEATIYCQAQGQKDYPIIFGQLTQRDGSFLVSKTPQPDFEWSMLRGKHVLAGRVGGVPAMTMQYIVNNAGLDEETDLNFNTDVAFNMMAPVFESDDTVAVSYTHLTLPTIRLV